MINITKQSPITLVELPATAGGVLNGKPVHDVYSLVRLPSRSLHVLESMLRINNWENVQSLNPIYHGENGKLTKNNKTRVFSSDILGMSSITRTSPQSMALIKWYKALNPEGVVIAGGMDPTSRVEEWLAAGTDIVVRGEGERTIVELMDALQRGWDALYDVSGITFKDRNHIESTGDRSLLTPEELSALPLPYYDESVRTGVNVAVIETSRGCPHGCKYCGVTDFFGKRYRRRSNERVIDGLKDVKDMGRSLFFADDNLALRQRDTISLLEEIADENLGKIGSAAQVTVLAAENERLLESFDHAKLTVFCVGIESIYDDDLEDMGKPWNAERTKNAIKLFRDAGFFVHGMMMVGGDKDTPEKLKETSNWINDNLDTVQLFPHIPLPGTEYADRMVAEGRVLTYDYSLFDGHKVIVRPVNFTPLELQEAINAMYLSFYNRKSKIMERDLPREKRIAGMGFYRNISRAILSSLSEGDLQCHLEFLKTLK